MKNLSFSINPWALVCLVLLSVGLMSMLDRDNEVAVAIENPVWGGEPTLGEVTMFAGTFAPRGWAFCDGQLLPIDQNQALFSIIGTIYGGDGRTTFALPDLRGRVPVHSGGDSYNSGNAGLGLTARGLGVKGGQENTTQVIAHTHAAVLSGDIRMSVGDNEDVASPQGAFLSTIRGGNTPYSSNFRSGEYTAPLDASQLKATISANSGVSSLTNMQPYLGVNFIIAIQGNFPSRN